MKVQNRKLKIAICIIVIIIELLCNTNVYAIQKEESSETDKGTSSKSNDKSSGGSSSNSNDKSSGSSSNGSNNGSSGSGSSSSTTPSGSSIPNKGGRDGVSAGGGAQSSVFSTDIDSYEPGKIQGITKFNSMTQIIVTILRVLGTIISVIALGIIGLKFMIGSTQERAEYKETLVPYLIGAIMVFTIPNILGIIYDLVSSVKIK